MGETLAGPLIAGWLLALAGSDARTMRLPNRWILPAVLALTAAGIGELAAGRPAVLCAALVAATPYLAAFATRQCGAGDVKLTYVLGGLTAEPMSALAIVLLAQVVAVACRVRSPTTGGAPHAPALTVAAVIVW